MGHMTGRTALTIAIAAAVVVPTNIALNAIGCPSEVASLAVVLPTAPIGAVGCGKLRGLRVEQFMPIPPCGPGRRPEPATGRAGNGSNGRREIVSVDGSVPAWRLLIAPRGAVSVLELPAGTLEDGGPGRVLARIIP